MLILSLILNLSKHKMKIEQNQMLMKSDSELYLILANQLINENLLQFITPIDDDEKKIQSQRWFNSFIKKEKLKKAICSSSFVTEEKKSEEVIAALADIIVQNFLNLPDYMSFTLAILLTRYGLQKYCSHDNSSI